MEDRIDPLIRERARWLFSDHLAARQARYALHALLGYRQTVALAQNLADLPSDQIMARMANLLAKQVNVTGLDHLPKHGAALVVANHPTGIADGIILHHVLAAHRSDAFYFANQDILRVLPQMHDMIAPVEWRHEKRSHAKTRETMAYTRKAVGQGRLGVIFPSGRLAKRRGLKLYERPWMASAAMIARKFDLPIVPINISARNSALFYLFDLIHPSLRDITLFHETLNKHKQPYRVRIGEPISASALPNRSEEGIEMLRQATLNLSGPSAPNLSLIHSSRRPFWLKALRTT